MFNRDSIALVALSVCGLCMLLGIFPASIAADRPDSDHPFDADFALPKGYELLSVVGPVVADFYEHNQDRGQGRGRDNYLHVNFSSAPLETTLALVLTNNNISLNNFTTPVITSLDAENQHASRE
ncbi:MAG: hypothetical protein KAJ46_07155 [Sedimentisphaerales bacterium]|nr:hypothetical protein [Sedimentisphaerales bacterium]